MLIPDNVLVAVSSYYIGQEKEFTGEFPFTVLVYVVAACMITSEIIATRKKRKIRPENPKKSQGNQGKKMVIFKLIPFTRLNLIFAFSALLTAMIRILQRTQKVPNLSIQLVVMLLCLLATNREAKLHFKTETSPQQIYGSPNHRSLPPTHHHKHSSQKVLCYSFEIFHRVNSHKKYKIWGEQKIGVPPEPPWVFNF
jgi:hypothetical protein